MKQDEIIFKEKKWKMEMRLNRKLTNDEKQRLYGEIITGFILETKIPAAEESELELDGLKD
ncbi:MAG: hypothetical protein WCW25_03255 [Patescibacteria group bacterium]|jgi:hypothetical protein